MMYLKSSPFQQGIVIVDSPGIGESAIMDDTVKEYLPEAFAFIYVINSVNAGGIQRDRVRDSYVCRCRNEGELFIFLVC